MHNMRRTILDIVVLTVICVLAYANTFTHAFLHDDKIEILENPLVKDIKNLPKAFVNSAWGWQENFGSEEIRSNYYRPVQSISYIVLYSLFGENPLPFHIYKIFLHAVATALVYLVVREMMRGMNGNVGARRAVPLLAGMLFALHPMHVEAVTWIAGITDVSCTVFVLASFWCFVKANGNVGATGRSPLHVASAVFFFLGLLSKEIGVMLLPLIFVYLVILSEAKDLKKRDSSSPQQNMGGRLLRMTGVFIAPTALYLILRLHALGAFAPEGKYAELTGLQVVLNAFPLLAGYFGKLLLPLSFNFHYTFQPVLFVSDLSFIGSFLLVAAIIFSAWIFRRKYPVYTFGIVWTILFLLPVLHAQKLGLNVFTERYLYLPSAGICVILGAILGMGDWQRTGVRPDAPTSYMFHIFLAVLLLFYAFQTVQRNAVLKDDLTLWRETVRASPDSAFVRKALGNTLAAVGASGRTPLLDAAIIQYEEALRIDPEFDGVHDNWGNVLGLLGRPDEAIGHYREAIRVSGDSLAARVNLGNGLADQRKWAEAEEQYRAGLVLMPDSSDAYIGLGRVQEWQGRLDEAESYYRQAVRVDGANPMAYNNIGNLYAREEDWKAAEEYYSQAVALNPKFTQAQYNLASILTRQGREEEAVSQYREVLRLDPQHEGAHYDLGNILAHRKQFDEASEHFRAALAVNPRDLDARNNLAVMMMEQGDFEHAVEEFRNVLRMDPFYMNARRGLGVAMQYIGKEKAE